MNSIMSLPHNQYRQVAQGSSVSSGNHSNRPPSSRGSEEMELHPGMCSISSHRADDSRDSLLEDDEGLDQPQISSTPRAAVPETDSAPGRQTSAPSKGVRSRRRPNSRGRMTNYLTSSNNRALKFFKIVLLLLAGIGLAVGHEKFYANLDGNVAGSPGAQQLNLNVGTFLSTATVALLGLACLESYNQYFWFMAQKFDFDLETLDDFFVPATVCVRLIKWVCCCRKFDWHCHTRERPRWIPSICYTIFLFAILIIVSLVCICLMLCSIPPPGTLTVSPALRPPITANDSVAVLDWSFVNRGSQGRIELSTMAAWLSPETQVSQLNPNAQLRKLAFNTASSLAVVQISPSTVNASWITTFEGPTLKCEAPDASQAGVFRAIEEKDSRQHPVQRRFYSTRNSFNSTEGTSSFLVFSSFLPSPQYFYGAQFCRNIMSDYNSNLPNTWKSLCTSTSQSDEPLQLWVRTATETLVCTLSKGAFTVGVDITNGQQSITQHNVTVKSPIYARTGNCTRWYAYPWYVMYNVPNNDTRIKPCLGNISYTSAYIAGFRALTDMLVGNISIRADIQADIENKPLGCGWQFDTASSSVLQTGLVACPEFRYWETVNTSQASSPYDSCNGSRFDYLPASTCRNGTLATAIADLMNNITIGMLGVPGATVVQTVPVTTWETQNTYQYEPFWLRLPYGVGGGLAVFVVVVGLLSLSRPKQTAHDSGFAEVARTMTLIPNTVLAARESRYLYRASNAANGQFGGFFVQHTDPALVAGPVPASATVSSTIP